VKIMVRAKSRISCKPLFKTSEILTLSSQYVLYLKTFLIHNLEYFTSVLSVYAISTRKKVQLHRPKAKQIFLSYQRGVYYARIKIFNTLPASVAE
jgi:hypothetical protein